jgi:hypothetical protein
MDPNHGGAPSLQFDTAIPQVAPSIVAATPGAACSVCQSGLVTEYYDVNGQSVCGTCRAQLADMAQTPSGVGALGKAGLFGLGAAIAGAILYYAVIAITNFEIGIVAIAIGYMVGWAVRTGAGNRGGRRFQVLALVLTYWAVGLAYTPLAFQEMTGGGAQLVFLIGFSLVLPILSVVSSMPGGLISAAIIAFGMHQAWQMTGAPAMTISGPYRIAGDSAAV